MKKHALESPPNSLNHESVAVVLSSLLFMSHSGQNIHSNAAPKLIISTIYNNDASVLISTAA